MKAIDEITRRISIERLRTYPVVLLLARLQIHHAVLTFARTVNDVGILWIRHDWTRLASWTCAPVSQAHRVGLTGNDYGRVVLLGAVELVRKLIISPNAVDLRGRLIHLRRPRAPTIVRDVRAAIVRLNDDVAVFRTDPNVVVVAMRRAKRRERLAAVRRFPGAFRARVNHVGVRRIGAELHVIERTLNHRIRDLRRL